MENASKALIIAGAIILSVLIIGLGMSIFMTSSNSTQDASLDEQTRMQFNSKFDNYKGIVQGSRAMSLCETVRNHNLSNRADNTKQVKVEGPDATDIDKEYEGQATDDGADSTDKIQSASTVRAKLRSGKSYNVTMQYDKNTGLICLIHIRELK